MMKPIVCVSQKEYHKAENIFRADSVFECVSTSLEEKKLAAVIAERSAFGCILGVDNYISELYKVLPKGGVIARFGVGHDGINKQKATENGIIVTNTPGVLDDSVAEHAVTLMGCFARNICTHDKDMKGRRWQPTIGNELKDKTLLILGCGPIGRKTAKIASFGFGMKVIGYDIAKLNEDELKTKYGFNSVISNLAGVIDKTDYISIHMPSNPETRHFINDTFLSKLKPSCVVINTARGSIIDETALYDALKSERISGAALDVFEKEPFEPESPAKDMRTLENVILSPHVGSSTVEACQRMAKSCLENMKAAYEKRYDQLNILNPQVLGELK